MKNEKRTKEEVKDINWKFYLKSSDAWVVMLEDCRNAKESIDIEQFIFEYDEIGKKFADVLIEKAKAGVKVRMILDMVGSYNFFNSRQSRLMMKEGVEIRWHNIINPWRLKNFSSWIFRDHRKLMIVDSKVGHIGGVGIGYKMKDWRDTHARLEGRILLEMQDIFNLMWEMKEIGRFLKSQNVSYFTKNFDFLTNSPRFQQRFFYQSLIENIRNAKKKIYLTSPYFIPDMRLFRVLRLAAKRGVDVRIIIPKISDHIFLDYAARSYCGLLLKAGVKIYLYNNYFLHAKSFIIDEDWFAMGSANLDNLSLLFNYEVCLATSNNQFGKELTDHFKKDLSLSRELLLKEWRRRPILDRIRELVTWPLHNFL